MTTAAVFRWEMLFGESSPYGAFDAEAVDTNAFESTFDWTDVSTDVRTNPPPAWSRGMHGGSPVDRVAGVGVLNFALNNFPHGNPRKLGYYTPGHTNQRQGFGLGIGCRLRATYKELDRVLFIGTLEAVLVEPGEHASRHVDVVVTDWMEEAATNQVEDVETLVDVRSDEAFTAIVQSLPRQPLAIQTDTGMDTYAYAVDTARQEGQSAQSEFLKLAMSELGYIFLKADGTLVFEGRRRRGSESPTNVYTFDAETFHEVTVRRSRSEIINKVKVVVHPRRVDAAPVVLYRLVQAVQIGPGQTTRLFGGFSDPEQRGRRTGGFDFVTPVAGVDFIANSAGDGSGVDLTSGITVTVSTTGNGVSFEIRNTGSSSAWLTTLQLRGRGIYDFEHAVMEHEDPDSILLFGRRTRTIDMPYQSDALVGYSAAQYLISLYSDDLSTAESLSFLANESDETMRQALIREISDRIGVRESVTGLTDVLAATTATRGWFINGVRGEIISGKYLRTTYILSPADRNMYWLLGVAGATELAVTTRLGYGIFQGHIDTAHADAHADSFHQDDIFRDIHGDVAHADGAHADAAHTDTHGDSAHIDVAHADTHGDILHVDSAHTDSHSDVTHVDTHSDVTHVDVPHDDVGHNDVPHIDDAHQDHDDLGSAEQHHDTPHADQGHEDTAHGDAHTDTAHEDTHADQAHADSHNDQAHSDTAHADTHSDVIHSDTPHGDTHTDGGHGDAAHADTAHTDTHTDVKHVDAPHEDTHSDVGHGDTFG